MSHPVKLVGLGVGPRDLTLGQREVIADAQLLAGGERQLAMFPQAADRRLPLSSNLDSWLDQVARAATEQQVVVLASGDPLFYGIGRRLLERLGPDAVEILPNLTSVQAAFALLKEPWQDARVVSLHGGRDWRDLWWSLAGSRRVAVFSDPSNTPAKIAQALLERDQAHWSLAVLENLGGSSQKVSECGLDEATEREFSPLNLVVLKRTAWPQLLGLGLPEEAFQHQRGMITKSEVRTAVLAGLELRPGQTLWDLGAGCGSVGLEAGLLLTGGRVVALEMNPQRVADIRANRARFGAAWLEVIQDRAPKGLEALPDPDRVFLGGGGASLAEVVPLAAQRLSPGGVMLASVVRLHSLNLAMEAMTAAGLELEVSQMAVSRGAELAGSFQLKALNPVWLVKGRKVKQR
jgi:precorrin-6Y C5,15-methyltransferase (decarboxylating)